MQNKERRRPKIGDVIEISTPNGLAYAQYTHEHPTYGSLLRVLPSLFEERPSQFSDLVQMPERFVTFFPLGPAVWRRIVTIVACERIPKRARDFPLFRTGVRNPATGRVDTWWLWDGEREWPVGELTPQMRSLPLRGIWNDTLLIQRIVEGWSPTDEV